MQQRKSENNRPVISGVIAAVCIVVYVIALVQAAIRIYISTDQRRTVAEQEFYDIADLASAAGVLGFMDEPFIETINDALTASAALEGLIISGPNGEYAFERERGRAISWVNNSPRFRNRLGFSGQSLYRPLRIEGLRNVNIQAVASALDYRILTGILKQTLLLVLAALVAAFFTLLMESLLGKTAVKSRYASYEPEENFMEEPAAPARPPEDFEPPQPEPPKPETGQSQEEAVPLAETPAEEPVPVVVPPPQDAGPLPAAEQPKEPPKGLYSPHGNIGWAEYTNDRLESELHRCASSEQDLVFIIIEYKYSKTLGGAFYNQFAEDAVHFFTNRDLIFEKGERGIAVIHPNIDLDAGFAKCDEFHDRILDKYPGAFKAKTDLCIGLSSRSGRLIDAKRLMFEASEALERSLADPVSHIVAFKSDPDKYRAFIASQNRRHP
jgi:hypothetical protein